MIEIIPSLILGAVVVLVLVLAYQERQEWAVERRELLNRLATHGNLVVHPPAPNLTSNYEPPEDEGEMALVGRVIPINDASKHE